MMLLRGLISTELIQGKLATVKTHKNLTYLTAPNVNLSALK